MSFSRRSGWLIGIVLAVSSMGLLSCGVLAPTPATNCAPGLFDYKGTCLDPVSQNFVSCTETRGNNMTIEEKQKFDASVGIGVKSGSGAVEISRKVVETELPEVAIEIVRDCLELSKNIASPAEQLSIEDQIEALDAFLDATTKGTIALNPDRGPYDQVIGVSGTDWPPNIEVEITAGPARVRTTTTADGTFATTITLDPNFEDVSPSSVVIRVEPVEASMQLGADALYTIVK